MKYKEISGDLIDLALQGTFDVIAHGCNCFCTMGAGIAPQMANAFGCDKFDMELTTTTSYDCESDEYYIVKTNNKGNINKLGQIDYKAVSINTKTGRWLAGYSLPKPDFIITVTVVNAYTQFHYSHKLGAPIDYEAIALCMRKLNRTFKGERIGLPKIGAGLAGGDWNRIKTIIQTELKDCDVTVVIYDKNK